MRVGSREPRVFKRAARAQGSTSEPPQRNSGRTIYAFGFERLGLTFPTHQEATIDDCRVEFLRYGDARRLDGADGVILASGLFETLESQPSIMGPYVEVTCDRDQLLSRFREIANAIQKGKWVCCLVGRIIDEVPQGHSKLACKNTDLVKKLLNGWQVERTQLPDGALAHAKYDEFKKYIQRWGVAKTILMSSYSNQRTLATIGSKVVGLECDSQIFFLPFHTAKSDATELPELAAEVMRAVESYLRKRQASLPEWVDGFQFAAEKAIGEEYEGLVERLSALEAERSRWRGYKGILSRSGDALRETVATILRDFFGLRVGDEDVGIEDLAIKDESGDIAVIIETKGTNAGVQRSHINQVDFHRERRGLESKIPGVLIINDFMEIPDLEARGEKPVAQEQVSLAHHQNIVIMRSIDLLNLMRDSETAPVVERSRVWTAICSGGGGILARGPTGKYCVTRQPSTPREKEKNR